MFIKGGTPDDLWRASVNSQGAGLYADRVASIRVVHTVLGIVADGVQRWYFREEAGADGKPGRWLYRDNDETTVLEPDPVINVPMVAVELEDGALPFRECAGVIRVYTTQADPLDPELRALREEMRRR